MGTSQSKSTTGTVDSEPDSEPQVRRTSRPSSSPPNRPAEANETTPTTGEASSSVRPKTALPKLSVPQPSPRTKAIPSQQSAVAPPVMGTLEEQLNEMLECKICFEYRERQKLLPCQHTICLECLNQLPLNGSVYKCPLCNQEQNVPNGGFEALQDSLVTKQLASLITLQKGQKKHSAYRLSKLQTDAVQHKFYEIKEKETEALTKAKELIATLSKDGDEVEEQKAVMLQKVNDVLEQSIQKLTENATTKASAIQYRLDEKKRLQTERVEKLKTVVEKVEDSLKQAEECTISQETVNQAQQAFSELRDLLPTSESNGRKLRAGDSVQLKLDKDHINPTFLLNEQSHCSVGYLVEIDSDDDCTAIFPEDSKWAGKGSQLEYSDVKHDLPRLGDLVKVKPSIVQPQFGWGLANPTSVGFLAELTNRGGGNGRVVIVDFDEDHQWKCLFDELEKVTPEPLKVGETVWISREVTEPSRGWAGVTPISVGKLVGVSGEDVEVDFPECRNWKGFLKELERSRRIIVGDHVKVKSSVREPKFSWGGVDHSSVGKVTEINHSSEHGSVCKLDFPGRLASWKCLMSEIEIVRRLAAVEKPRSRDLSQCAAM